MNNNAELIQTRSQDAASDFQSCILDIQTVLRIEIDKKVTCKYSSSYDLCSESELIIKLWFIVVCNL